MRGSSSGRTFLIDLDARTTRELAPRTQGALFDRRSRYLAYANDDGSPQCDLHVIALDQPEQPPRVVPRDAGPARTFGSTSERALIRSRGAG